MKKQPYNRRKFLGTASCAAVGTATFFSTIFNLSSVSAASMQHMNEFDDGEDYRALVCILLGGGNDSYNMLVPTSTDAYNHYSQTRSNLALAKDTLLPLSLKTGNSTELGLHPSMTELKDLYDQNKVAFLSNVGTLVEPTTKAQFGNFGSKLPLGLFSHSDQAKHWQTSIPDSRNTIGWGGRLADLVMAANENEQISMNISLSGKNVFQSGLQTSEYSILPNGTGSVGIQGYGGNDMFNTIRTSAVKSLLEKEYQDIFQRTYGQGVQFAQNTHELFSQEIGDTVLRTSFSDHQLSRSLQMIARTIKIRKELGMKRQTFFVQFGGWDHHDEVLNNQMYMLSDLSKAMKEFDEAMQELDLGKQVTTFLISDFARTLTSNGNGTDHAWGGNVIVMGDAVKGGDVYGTYPSLQLGNELELGGGVLIPQISTDEYFAELALWYGVTNHDLKDLFPNIGNFYDTSSTNMPLGFMNI